MSDCIAVDHHPRRLFVVIIFYSAVSREIVNQFQINDCSYFRKINYHAFSRDEIQIWKIVEEWFFRQNFPSFLKILQTIRTTSVQVSSPMKLAWPNWNSLAGKKKCVNRWIQIGKLLRKIRKVFRTRGRSFSSLSETRNILLFRIYYFERKWREDWWFLR